MQAQFQQATIWSLLLLTNAMQIHNADLDVVRVALQEAVVDGARAGPAGEASLLSAVQAQQT